MQPLLTIEEVSKMLQLKVSTIYDWVHRKKIRHVKMGRLVRFRLEDINALINANTHEKQYVGV